MASQEVGRSEEIKEVTMKRLSWISKVDPKWSHKVSIITGWQQREVLPQGKKVASPLLQDATLSALQMKDAGEART